MKQRWHEIDICRGLGILLVMYAHALEMSMPGLVRVDSASFMQWQAIYTFHMPLFFMLSGAVHRHQGLMQALRSAAFLVCLALLNHVLGWLAHSGVAFAEAGTPFNLINLIRPIYSLQWFSTVVVWFLVSLGLTQVLHALLIGEKSPLRLLLLGAGVLAIGAHYVTQRYVFQLCNLLPSLVCFHVGWRLAASQGWRESLQKWPDWGVAALSAGMVAAVAVLAPRNGGCTVDPFGSCPNVHDTQFAVFMVIGKLGFLPIFALTVLAGALGTYALAVLLARRSPDGKMMSALMWTGRHSLLLMMLNGFVFTLVQPRLVAAFEIGPGPLSSMSWAIGLTAAQILVMPAWRWMATPLVKLSHSVADAFTVCMERLPLLGRLAVGR